MEGIMRNEIQVKNYKGKNILVLDFSKSTKVTVPEIIADAKDYIKKQPKNSLYTLTDITGLNFNKQMIEQFEDFTSFNKPYVVAGVVIGMQGLQKIAYNAIMTFSGRKLPTFNTQDEGMDWLVKQ
jgi:hypothetical protein